MLVLCDFDGTVTATDTLNHLCRTYTPELYAELEGRLVSGDLTLEDVLEREIRALRESVPDLADIAAAEVPIRDGFDAFVDAADSGRFELVIVSSGFRELIMPMLASRGHDHLRVIANSADLADPTGPIAFRDGPTCSECGQRCKRHDVRTLRDEVDDGTPVAFVGDGYSDLCGCREADQIFATGHLARWLDERRVAHRSFTRFDEILAHL